MCTYDLFLSHKMSFKKTYFKPEIDYGINFGKSICRWLVHKNKIACTYKERTGNWRVHNIKCIIGTDI
jgi:hypothetical protein